MRMIYIYIEVKSRSRASKKARVTARQIREPTTKLSRQEAARRCVAVFDTGFFKALCEPARIAALRELILLGRADIGDIAARMPQDRSVIARHLHQLAAAQIVKAKKEGRHVFYEIDASAVAERLEGILAITRLLQSAMRAETRTAKVR
jgi:DNA-binding transcriptional ArsR family regulator